MRGSLRLRLLLGTLGWIVVAIERGTLGAEALQDPNALLDAAMPAIDLSKGRTTQSCVVRRWVSSSGVTLGLW